MNNQGLHLCTELRERERALHSALALKGGAPKWQGLLLASAGQVRVQEGAEKGGGALGWKGWACPKSSPAERCHGSELSKIDGPLP